MNNWIDKVVEIIVKEYRETFRLLAEREKGKKE